MKINNRKNCGHRTPDPVSLGLKKENVFCIAFVKYIEETKQLE